MGELPGAGTEEVMGKTETIVSPVGGGCCFGGSPPKETGMSRMLMLTSPVGSGTGARVSRGIPPGILRSVRVLKNSGGGTRAAMAGVGSEKSATRR